MLSQQSKTNKKIIAISAAMDQEINPLLEQSKIKTQSKIANVDIYECELFGKEVIIYKTNISRTNAAIATTIVLQKYLGQIELLINVGSSGAGDINIDIFHTVISNKLNYSENRVDEWENGQVPYMPKYYQANLEVVTEFSELIKEGEEYSIGNFVCSESFLSNKDVAQTAIKENPLPISSIDMESTAIAQTCHVFDIPFIGLRTISDNIFIESDNNPNEQFKENIGIVYKGYIELIKRYFEK